MASNSPCGHDRPIATTGSSAPISSRRLPQNHLDDVAFPIRVKLRVPEEGFGPLLLDMLHWLGKELGRGNFARHEADALEGEALAVHFRRIEDALEFLATFPEITLADGTGSRSYRLQPIAPPKR